MAHYRKQVLSILLNDRCNLRCAYCYINSEAVQIQDYHIIDLKFAKKGVDDFFSKFESRAIRFFAAGEPTLELGLMREIKNYADSKTGDGRLFVELQTNGVFSSETASWITNNVDIVWISYDGMPEFHDLLRRTVGGKPTARVVERNIHYLLKRGKPKVGVRATISRYNVHRQKEMVEYLYKLGVRILAFDPMCEPIHLKDHLTNTSDLRVVDPMDFAHNFLSAWERAKELGIFLVSDQIWNFDEPTSYACRACIPYPHLTPDGYVSACDMASSGTGLFGDLIYGFYDSEKDAIIYDEEKLTRIRMRTAENMIDCQGCELLYNCAGYCLGEGLNETGSLFRHAKDNFCNAMRFLGHHLPLNAGLYPYSHP